MKKLINVFQSQLNKEIPLEYVGKVLYKGETFGASCLTTDKEYVIVKDEQGDIKVVDDSDEDYFYDFSNPGPSNGNPPRGKFIIIDDPFGYLIQLI